MDVIPTEEPLGFFPGRKLMGIHHQDRENTSTPGWEEGIALEAASEYSKANFN